MVADPDAISITLYSGGRYYPQAVFRSDFEIRDIAHALSLMPRFAGHSPRFISVAQHSVEVSETCAPDDALWGLLHDASEAYLMDIPSPIKHTPIMAGYRQLEEETMVAICGTFGLPPNEPPSVRQADRSNLRSNWVNPEPWDPEVAEVLFLSRYFKLTGKWQ